MGSFNRFSRVFCTFLVIFLCHTVVNGEKPTYNYTTNWFEVPLDHFSYVTQQTFKIR